jgi:hypothetical protein
MLSGLVKHGFGQRRFLPDHVASLCLFVPVFPHIPGQDHDMHLTVVTTSAMGERQTTYAATCFSPVLGPAGLASCSIRPLSKHLPVTRR